MDNLPVGEMTLFPHKRPVRRAAALAELLADLTEDDLAEAEDTLRRTGAARDAILAAVRGRPGPGKVPPGPFREPAADDPAKVEAALAAKGPLASRELVALTGVHPMRVKAILLDLQKAGRVQQLPDGRFQLVGTSTGSG